MLGLESLDLGLDACLALLERELGSPVLFALRSPVLRLLSGLEGGVLTNGGVRVRENLLNVLRTDAVSKVSRELLLKAKDTSAS